jgi:YD repeat-containing protein
MVAIVSGNSLGLNLTSLATLGERGLIGNAFQGRGREESYVNIATGISCCDTWTSTSPARGPDGAAVRTYNSRGTFDDDNGDNWSSFARQRVTLNGTYGQVGSTMTLIGEDGSAALFAYDASISRYRNTDLPGRDLFLAQDGGNYVVFESNDPTIGQRSIFSAATGKLSSIVDASGNTKSYTYDTANPNLVKSIVTSSGESIEFIYAGNNLTEARTHYVNDAGVSSTLTRTRYAYDSFDRLVKVTFDLTPEDNSVADGKTYTTTYTYDGTSKRILTATESDGTQLAFTYVLVGSDYRVASVRDRPVSGHQVRIRHHEPPHHGDGPDGAREHLRIRHERPPEDDPGPGERDRHLRIHGRQPDLGHRRHRTRRGHGVRHERKRRAAARLGRKCGRADVRRIRADDFGEGGSLSGLGRVGSAAARGCANDPLLLRRLPASPLRREPEGRVTEYRYEDAAGNRTAAITYAHATFDPASGGSPELWAAEQFLADRPQIEFTSLEYDARGLLKTETRQAGLNLNGTFKAGASVKHFVYDSAGLLRKTIVDNTGPSAETTLFAYDGLGRLVATTDALGQVTTTTYDDAGRRTTQTLANGLLKIAAYDRAGRLISTLESSAGAMANVTEYFHDAAGRLVMTMKTDGGAAQTSPPGQLLFTVDTNADGKKSCSSSATMVRPSSG